MAQVTAKCELTNVQVMRNEYDDCILIEYEVRVNKRLICSHFETEEATLVEHLEAYQVLCDEQCDTLPNWAGIEPEFEDVIIQREVTFADFLNERMANDNKEVMHYFLVEHDRNYPH